MPALLYPIPLLASSKLSSPKPSEPSRTKPCFLSYPTSSLSKAFASTPTAVSPKKAAAFSLPNWTDGKTETRSRELRLHDAFLYLENMVGKGHRPNPGQATQLLYDLCRFNKFRTEAEAEGKVRRLSAAGARSRALRPRESSTKEREQVVEGDGIACR